MEDSEPTQSEAGTIRQICRSSVHQICSGQVVLSLATAAKELLENSLDAGASVIELRLRGQGTETVELTDNGSGVAEENFAGLTVKHATSKLREFSDLTSVETFGFRGEALSSLCGLSSLTVSTRHREAETGTLLTFNHDGEITSRVSVARPIGTTVTLQNLFSTMPVRQKEFTRNIKKEYSKLISVISSYGLVASGVKIKVTNVKANNKSEIVLQTHGSHNLQDNLVNIFGVKAVANLKPIVQATLSEEDLKEANIRTVPEVSLKGFISSHGNGNGRGAPDRQFYFINSRPCDHGKLSKIVNQVYHGYNRNQYPFVCLNITTARDSVDVNITPDKRQIFLAHERYLIELVKKTLEMMYKEAPCTMPANNFLSASNKFKSSQEEEVEKPQRKAFDISLLKRSFSKSFGSSGNESTKKQRTMDGFVQMNASGEGIKERTTVSENVDDTLISPPIEKKKVEDKTVNIKNDPDEGIKGKTAVSEKVEDFLISPPIEENDVEDKKGNLKNDEKARGSYEEVEEKELKIIFDVLQSGKSEADEKVVTNKEEVGKLEKKLRQAPQKSEVLMELDNFRQTDKDVGILKGKDTLKDEKSDINNKTTIPTTGKDFIDTDQHTVTEDNKENQEVIKSRVDVAFDMNKLRESLKMNDEESSQEGFSRLKFKAQISPSDNNSAETELRKQLQKTDFAEMKIYGQFNLGFIITGLDNDLFIVDQHATDEKYNFETLQKTTVITSQKMVLPQKLELTSVNESILMDNVEMFEKNGFKFEIDSEAPPTQRIRLVSLPMSKNWTFGKDDIDELIFMLAEGGESREILRPSRVRAMFASRACRRSVMIGRALSGSEMRRIISHMGQIEQPWNCPHGRPTIRHLINTNMLK